jgi:hypothetical protein
MDLRKRLAECLGLSLEHEAQADPNLACILILFRQTLIMLLILL